MILPPYLFLYVSVMIENAVSRDKTCYLDYLFIEIFYSDFNPQLRLPKNDLILFGLPLQFVFAFPFFLSCCLANFDIVHSHFYFVRYYISYSIVT